MVGTIFLMLLLLLGAAVILFFLFFVFLPSLNAQKSASSDHLISIDEFNIVNKKEENSLEKAKTIKCGKLIFCANGISKLVYPEQQEDTEESLSDEVDTLETVKLYRKNIPWLFNFWLKCYKILHRKQVTN